jgi:ankyrin repeat protein
VRESVWNSHQFSKISEEGKSKIEDDLTRRANGMLVGPSALQLIMSLTHDRFRWVALQLDALLRCRNMGTLLQTLSTLPTTLDETYTRILQQIEENERLHVRRILQWVCFSAVALRPVELAEVHRIGGYICPPFSPHDVLFQVEDIFAICPGFLILESEGWSEKEVVQFAHFSVKEYLLSPRALSWGFTELESHISIVRASIAYFLYMVSQEKCDTAEQTLTNRVSKYPLGDYVTSQCGYHLNFITPRDHPDLEESFHALLDPKSAPLLVHNLGICFLPVMDPNSLYHPRQLEALYPQIEVPKTLSLIVASVLGLSQALRWLFSFESLCDWADVIVTQGLDEQKRVSYWPLLCASRCGHVDVVRLLIQRGANVNLNHSGTALTKACQYKQLEVVKALLEYGADAECACALWWSCHTGFEEGVQVLLDAGVNVSYDDGKNGNALWAVVTGPENPYHGNAPRIVQMLLDAEVEVNYMGNHARSVLEEAVYRGLKEVVQILLAAGVDVQQGDRSESALQIALPREDVEMIQMLLNAGACIDETGGDLQRASHGGHVEVVQMILDVGADVNQVARGWETALQAASHGGHVELVHKLLKAGADVNQMGGTYRNALTAAIHFQDKWGNSYIFWDRSTRNQVLAIVQTLLDAGAEVNQNLSGEYGNALHAAAERGNIEVVQILVDVGADVNAYGGKWGSALQAASGMGHKEIVLLLLQAGADVNQQGGEGGNAIQAAANHVQQDIVQILMDAGARINWNHTSHQEYYKFRGLHEAADSEWERADMIQLLLDVGANINQKRESRTALEIASYWGYTENVQLLLQAGADVNQRCGPYYGSALQSASYRGYEEIVQMLLDAGANVCQRGGRFGSALGAALAHNPYIDNPDKEKVIQMLLDAGADLIGEMLVGKFWSLVETEFDHRTNET